MRIFFALALLLLFFNLAYAKVFPLQKETASSLVRTLDKINSYTTSTVGEVQGCNCDKVEESFLSQVGQRIQERLYSTQGSGISIGGDAHVGPGGVNYSFELLRFGSVFTLLDSSKGVQYAAYCIGGVGGGIDLSATLGVGSVQTFGRCDSPSDYAGGFFNFGVQGELAVGSIGAKLSVSFDMKTFSKLLEEKFSSKEKRERLRNQLLSFISLSKDAVSSDEGLLAGKIASSIFFPSEAPLLTMDEAKGFKTLEKKEGEDFFKNLNSKFEKYVKNNGQKLCSEPQVCSGDEALELTEFFSVIGESLGRCHGLSLGLSVGPSMGPPVSAVVGYNDYVLMGSMDLNLGDLSVELAEYVSDEVENLWDSFTASCEREAQRAKERQEKLQSIEQAFYESAKLQFNEDVLRHSCEKTLINSAKNTSKALEYIFN